MKKYVIQLVVGLLLATGIFFLRMPQMEAGTAGTIMAVSDGFAVTGLLYIGFGVLFYASGSGFFDFINYAFQRGVSLIVPRFDKGIDNYYEYKVKKQEERKLFSMKSTVILGLVFLVISAVFTGIWYKIV